MRVGGQRHAPVVLPMGKRAGIHCTGGWVNPKAGLDGCGKSRPHPHPGFDPRTVQPVASRYTDYAIPQGAVRIPIGYYCNNLLFLQAMDSMLHVLPTNDTT